jgi:hypothetical protein
VKSPPDDVRQLDLAFKLVLRVEVADVRRRDGRSNARQLLGIDLASWKKGHVGTGGGDCHLAPVSGACALAQTC